MARGLLNLGANVGVHAPGRVSGIAGILAVEAYPPVAHVKRRRFTCIRGNPAMGTSSRGRLSASHGHPL